MFFDLHLLKIRAISFGYDAVSLLLTVLVATLASPQFADIVNEHFASTGFAGIILIVIANLVKHLRNLDIVQDVGGTGGKPLI